MLFGSLAGTDEKYHSHKRKLGLCVVGKQKKKKTQQAPSVFSMWIIHSSVWHTSEQHKKGQMFRYQCVLKLPEIMMNWDCMDLQRKVQKSCWCLAITTALPFYRRNIVKSSWENLEMTQKSNCNIILVVILYSIFNSQKRQKEFSINSAWRKNAVLPHFWDVFWDIWTNSMTVKIHT